MLETASKFIRQLRSDRIAAPTVRRFTEDGWRQDFNTMGSGTAEELIVFEAGLWVGAALRGLWDEIAKLELHTYGFDDLVAVLMALSFSESNRQNNDDTPGRPKPLTADYGATALGDALWRALSHLYADRANLTGSARVPDEAVMDLLQLCGTIYVLEFLMGRVIHCGWELQFDAEGPIFQPSAPNRIFAQNEAIALEIRSEDVIEFFLVYGQLWQEGKLREEAPFHLRLTHRTPTRAAFRFVEQPPTKMPETIPLFDLDIPRWLYPLMDTVPSELGGLPVRQIVGAWLLLHEVFGTLNDREVRTGSEDGGSCVLHEDDLRAAFRLCKYPDDVAQKVISFFTYDWSRHESLWASPLVKLGEFYHPFLPAILHPNISRSVDLWLKKFTFPTSKGKPDTLIRRRGVLFEQFARTSLAETIAERGIFDAAIHREAITMAGHEIDLLLRVGKTVFVGDTKFQKYPANPNEIGNYYRELEHGAEQVLDRVKSLDGKRKEIKRLLDWPGDENDLLFAPLVVSGHAYGAGMKFRGVPCLTLDMLDMLFREEKFVMSGFDGSFKDVRQIALPFEQRRDRFEGFAALYVDNPAAVWFRQFAVRVTPVVCCSIEPDIEVRFLHHYVDMPRTVEREAYCDPLVTQWDALMADSFR